MDENRPMTKSEKKAAKRAEKASIYHEEKKNNMIKWGIIGIASVIFLGFFAFLVFLIKQKNAPTTNEPVKITENTGHVLVSGQNEELKEGSASAAIASTKVTLVEFGDLQCPACGAYYPVVKEVLSNYPDGQIKFIFKHFPLTSVHPNAMAAAEAAEAAGNQGKFFEYHDMLYENQSSWGELAAPEADAKFVEYAKKLNLDLDQFNKDRKDPATEAVVRKTMDEGIALGVNSTPTFFLDGEKVINPQNASDFKKLIDTKIK